MRHSLFILLSLFFLSSCSETKLSVPEQKGDFCSNIHRNDSLNLSDELSSFEEKTQHQTGVYVLEDGGGSLVTRAWLCEYAEQTIDIQYFIFATDNVGLIACDYLVRAADRGVKVRILLDDIMVEAGLEEILALDLHENISIKIYNPGVNLGKNLYGKLKKFTTDFRDANQRMHNKTFIVDGKVVITGGRNVADEYFDYDHEYNFRDRDVLLLGKVCKTINTSFNDFWTSPISEDVKLLTDNPTATIDSTTYQNLHQYACNPANFWPQIRSQIENLTQTFAVIRDSSKLTWVDNVYFISDKPGKNDGSNGLKGGGITTDTLASLIKQAEHTIEIQTPYLITSEGNRTLFKAAIERGVTIRILTNSLGSTDNLEAFSGYQSTRKQLLETGVQVYEFKPDAKERTQMMTSKLQKTLDHTPVFGLHAKTMVIDKEITVIGTFNLDPRSINLNTECLTIIESKRIAEGVLKGIEIEFQPDNSWETTLNFNPDSKVSHSKRIKTWTRKIIPKDIL